MSRLTLMLAKTPWWKLCKKLNFTAVTIFILFFILFFFYFYSRPLIVSKTVLPLKFKWLISEKQNKIAGDCDFTVVNTCRKFCLK